MKKVPTALTINDDLDEISTVHYVEKDPLPLKLQNLKNAAGGALTDLAKRRSFFSMLLNIEINKTVLRLKERIENITTTTSKVDLVNIYLTLRHCYDEVKLELPKAIEQELIKQLCENLTLDEILEVSTLANTRSPNNQKLISEETRTRYNRDNWYLKEIKKEIKSNSQSKKVVQEEEVTQSIKNCTQSLFTLEPLPPKNSTDSETFTQHAAVTASIQKNCLNFVAQENSDLSNVAVKNSV